ncbi:hypothetical protein [Vibrio hyugaensis]|uniref:hypothetical protein n=1 Tax=Vibrio hyugaensis TaxID=1534743 RepID=UPI0005EE3C60|nr:hypothetical protein [Vibrio hyugaensis]
MEHWKLDIENGQLKSAYDAYLYRQDSLITYYLSTVAVAKNAVFSPDMLNDKVRASSLFLDSATSIKNMTDIVELVESEKYEQLSRSMCILGMVTTFTDFFDEVRVLLDVPTQELKKPIRIEHENQEPILIRTLPLKIANYINENNNLDARIADEGPLRWLNCIMNIRHMFIHCSGRFDEKYINEMFGSWSGDFKANAPILFNEEQVDSILWYMNAHVRDFTNRLAKFF